MSKAKETISPFSSPAIPPLFLGVGQVQEFLVLVAVNFNPPISLPLPALNCPQEICTLISQMRQKRCEWLYFPKYQLHLVGAWGSLSCSAPFWMRPQALPSKMTAGSRGDGGAMAVRACRLVQCSQLCPFVCALIFLNKPKSPWVSVLLACSTIPKLLSKNAGLNKCEITGRALGTVVVCPLLQPACCL